MLSSGVVLIKSAKSTIESPTGAGPPLANYMVLRLPCMPTESLVLTSS